MKAPERLESNRLVLRRPRPDDAAAIFARYANDVAVTRYLAWPRHQTVEQTRAFLAFSDSEWEAWPAGPYLIESRESGELLGSTGFGFEAPDRAATGYVLARDAWGKGYATEALTTLLTLAQPLRHAPHLRAVPFGSLGLPASAAEVRLAPGHVGREILRISQPCGYRTVPRRLLYKRLLNSEGEALDYG